MLTLKSSVFLLAVLLAGESASISATSDSASINNNQNYCENIVCQDGFHCDPSYKCTRIPCVPQCIETGIRTDCRKNEELNECGNGCEPTCQEENPVCPAICGPRACKCEVGYVREPMGRCIKRAQCPMARLPRPRGQTRNGGKRS
ncbi:unnamed protein product, partial [Mesorhabditis belari]|uniref:TIL domain-containing protein n=1 Tax=Mesorhabditis belari TaxID=2138241 RepID=A0AAF3EGI0_9BILA